MHKCIEKDPDVLVLTERRKNKQREYVALDLSYNQYVINDVSLVKNTVCILTKQEAVMKSTYKHNVISIEYNWLHVWWVYFPQKNEKKEVFDFMYSNIANTWSVVIWDFNTGKYFEDELWKSFYCHKDFVKLSDEKLVDIRRIKNKHAKEYSRYSNSWNGFRIDHSLITSDIEKNITDAWYDHTVREKWLSDHSMMCLTIKL